MTTLDGIVEWNIGRNLTNFDAEKELKYIKLELAEFVEATSLGDEHEQVDAMADVIVFAVGAIHKMGYDPTEVLKEALKEISSRKGQVDPETGKWEKDKNQDPNTLYKARYTKK